MTRIPYSISFEIFIIFSFGGLGLSYLLRISLIKKYIEVNTRRTILLTMISGLLNGVFWFYLLMFLLFPNYLYQMGIVSVI